jgi:DNA-binding beta-propeller fold protein YncE
MRLCWLSIGFWLAAAAAIAAPQLRVDPSWPLPLPHGWILGQVSGVAIDASDNVWIIHRPGTVKNRRQAAPPVIQFDPAGHVLRAWGGPDRDDPGRAYDWPGNEHGIYVDPAGQIWIGGNGPRDGQVLKFTPAGKFLLQIGHPAAGANSADTTRLARPADMAVDAISHEIFIADGYANHRIIVFDAETGAFKRLWGAYGARPLDMPAPSNPRTGLPSQFATPVHCVKRSRDGLLYVCDRENDRVQIFHENGNYVTEWRIAPGTPGLGSVWDLAISARGDQSVLYCADGQSNEVRLLRRADGTADGAFGQPGTAKGEFEWVHSIAVDSHGDVYTGEVHHADRVQKFVPTQ